MSPTVPVPTIPHRPPALLWTLENLVEGEVVNRIKVPGPKRGSHGSP
jgi:hypothetical protein